MPTPTQAQESRAAIERLYVEMRHIVYKGSFRPNGITGKALRNLLFTLSPEIYGSMPDPEKVELDGLAYVIERLPKGIEECRFVKLISEEGYHNSSFEVLIPPKRVRNCYRIDRDRMCIEVTRGRSEIYDILTHLTFLYNEAEKIKSKAFDDRGQKVREWTKLEEIIIGEINIEEENQERAIAYISTLLGRTFAETKNAFHRFEEDDNNKGLFHIVYWLGKLAAESEFEQREREISFSPSLIESLGRHIYGEKWAKNIKNTLFSSQLQNRPMHIISANTHSVMNSLYAYATFQELNIELPSTLEEAVLMMRNPKYGNLQEKVQRYAEQHGMQTLKDNTGTNLAVQLFDTQKIDLSQLPPEIVIEIDWVKKHYPVLIVMDYAFGEQAYETMDELLKPPLETPNSIFKMPIASISIMGKAGILCGEKGDIMIPNAHVFEGTADNYPFKNDFTKADFEGFGVEVFEGTMITVLGTSLQNKDILEYFKDSSWQAIGLEMEGAHYQKAIQAESLIRGNISRDVVLRYAYYASDNPLITGNTLASGSLGAIGVKPTYLITCKILSKIFQPNL
ncbi:MAG: hypothetical protein EAZ55_10575 [Cytophagales bacterium]|nr:MAG: hypothetical protein EAZ55_10575 [Cytophagales bacterium]